MRRIASGKKAPRIFFDLFPGGRHPICGQRQETHDCSEAFHAMQPYADDASNIPLGARVATSETGSLADQPLLGGSRGKPVRPLS